MFLLRGAVSHEATNYLHKITLARKDVNRDRQTVAVRDTPKGNVRVNRMEDSRDRTRGKFLVSAGCKCLDGGNTRGSNAKGATSIGGGGLRSVQVGFKGFPRE